ncbi:MAG: fatty acid desaturase [Woeseia sp.]
MAQVKRCFATRHSDYGYRFNVRACYDGLPGQVLWTWLTGKGKPLTEARLQGALKPTGEVKLWGHLLFTWAIILCTVGFGHYTLTAGLPLPLTGLMIAFCWLMVVNRLRSIQATFHYLTHGALIQNTIRAKRYATCAMTAPLLYTGWDAYVGSHVREHHHIRNLCSDGDPDQRFIAAQGFSIGMPERTFWLRVWLTPFMPHFIAARVMESLYESFVKPSTAEIQFRATFWCVVIGLCALHGLLWELTLFYLFPLLVLFQHSMWLQLFTEHLWFSARDPAFTEQQNYGKLTWGRFQGRPLPRKGLLSGLTWLAKAIVLDIPVRLYVYPQDLPNHDFHHRCPKVSYWRIADVRATIENQPNRFGPQYEVWGFMSTLRVIRDHLCYGKSDPFGTFHNTNAPFRNNVRENESNEAITRHS